jgi:hypothetical protein
MAAIPPALNRLAFHKTIRARQRHLTANEIEANFGKLNPFVAVRAVMSISWPLLSSRLFKRQPDHNSIR